MRRALLLVLVGCGHGDLGHVDASVADATIAVDARPDAGPAAPRLVLLAGQLGGPGNLDGIADAARLMNGAFGMVSDGAGNLYVADTNNDTIRKLAIATGELTTVAGTAGIAGSVDGTGTAAQLDAPYGLASDGVGNLYVADNGGETIRKIVIATGVVSTLAGTAGQVDSVDGTGAAARFAQPTGLASDGAGNLFVVDHATAIRKIVIATGVVTTLAGTAGMAGSVDGTGAAARFAVARGVASSAGNLYVADGTTVRKIVVATGVVSTVAGMAGAAGGADGMGANARFVNPNAVATDGAGDLYVADSNDHTIRKIAIATALVTTVAGTSGATGNIDGARAAARFGGPYGVVSDGASGNLYATDTATIRRVTIATGAVTTSAGRASASGSTDGIGAAARFNFPYGVASDGDGKLYVSDPGSATIRTIEIATGLVTTLAGTADVSGSVDGVGAAARFSAPLGVATDGAGNLYVADDGNDTIRKIVIVTGAVTTLAGTPGATGNVDGVGAAARFTYPHGMASDGAGNLYVADEGNSTIRKIEIATGAVTTLAGTAGVYGTADGIGVAAQFSGPFDVTSDGAGNLYVADAFNHTIRKIAIATGVVTTVAGGVRMAGSADGIGAAARFFQPSAVSSDGAGKLYVADYGNSTIREIAIATGEVTTPIGRAGHVGLAPGVLPATLNCPADIVARPGTVAIIDACENAVLIADRP